jgi:hypothetical protein
MNRESFFLTFYLFLFLSKKDKSAPNASFTNLFVRTLVALMLIFYKYKSTVAKLITLQVPHSEVIIFILCISLIIQNARNGWSKVGVKLRSIDLYHVQKFCGKMACS